MAEETLLRLADLSFTGRRWQDVRTAVNRARRAGITALLDGWSAAPAAVREQVRALSAEWAAGKGLPEMGFTLGGLDEMDDPQVRLLLAVDAAERVLAVTSWLPVRADGVTVGWTLDLMRRRPDAPPGIMEFLIATAAVDVRADGAALLSLSGAPLARTATDGAVDAACSASWTCSPAGSNRSTASARCWRSRPSSSRCTGRCTWPTRTRSRCPPSATRWPAPTYPQLTPRALTRLARAVLG